MLMRFLVYIPLTTAICLLITDMTLITYTSYFEPAFPLAKYMGIPSILAIFFAVIGRFTIKTLELRKITVSYDKIAKTAYRLELAASRRKFRRVEAASNDDVQPELAIARAS